MANEQGYSRAERITRTKEFDRVFREGVRRDGRLLALVVRPNGLPQARLGIALGRAWRGGVVRNRAKRLVREAFRTHKDAIPHGIDLIVVPRRDWGEPRMEKVAEEIVRLLRRGADGMRAACRVPRES